MSWPTAVCFAADPLSMIYQLPLVTRNLKPHGYRRHVCSLLLAGLFHAIPASLPAAVRCPPLFGDHMVLQRDQPLPVWGEAAPGETVTVTFAGQTRTTAANPAGHWRVTLDPLPASAEPRSLQIQGSNTLAFADVLVGEVWFCSGQSNMEKYFGPRQGQQPVDNHELEVAAAHIPQLRLFQVPHAPMPPEGPALLHWLPCTPEALQQSGFSAVAYFFGQQVQRTIGVPVGLIHSSFGGTRIEAWLPPEAFAGPPLRDLPDQPYFAWIQGVQRTELYQSMVAPYAPFALRGFLWYQGETNLMAGNVADYAAKQTALIAGWRRAWGRPEAPFYGVLIAPMDYSQWEKFPVTATALPAFWAEQIKAFSAPHTGLVVTTDLVADTHDIHPTNKRDIGLRLARLALAETYGRADIPSRGPTFAGMKISGHRIELTFDHAEGLRSRDGQALTGFIISGENQTFRPAQARIEDGKVIVSHERVEKPVAVRFAWHETANPNLINGAGLPAVPFRTDDWPIQYLRSVPAGSTPTAK
jgi:sialate O-acetylesterase